MRRRIRLTESDLHKVISESVRQYLTELDWKTYMNAARKAADRAREIEDQGFPKVTKPGEFYPSPDHNSKEWKERARKLRQRDAFVKAAENSFNDQFGSSDSEDHYGSDYYAGNTTKDYGMEGSLYHPTTKLTKKHSWSEKPDEYRYYPISTEEFPLGNFQSSRGGYDIPYGNSNPKFQFGVGNPGGGFMSRKAANHGWVTGPENIDAGNKDLFDYENGNYEYRKGEGWRKKN